MHLTDLLLQPFLTLFCNSEFLISSFTALKIFESLISEAGLSKAYPPLTPLTLLTNLSSFK